MTPVKGSRPEILLFARSSAEQSSAANMLWSVFGLRFYDVGQGTVSTCRLAFGLRRDGVPALKFALGTGVRFRPLDTDAPHDFRAAGKRYLHGLPRRPDIRGLFDAGGAQRFLLPGRDQAPLSAQVLVFPVSKRKHLTAFALEEGDRRAPDRHGTAEYHLLAALVADEDHAFGRTGQLCAPPGLYSFAEDTLSHQLGRHKVNPPRPHATSASSTAA